MNLHLNKELFRDFIDNLNTKTGIDSDIIEKIIMYVQYWKNYQKSRWITSIF